MKLFLASAFDKTADVFSKKVGFSLKGKKVMFVANAADHYKGDKWWIRNDREAFIKLGCQVIDVDLRTITLTDFTESLMSSDIIHITGGSVIYPSQLIIKRGLSKPLKDAIRQNKIIYTGTSAGSMIVSKDLTSMSFDPDEKDFVVTGNSYSGLGLIDFIILPHAGNKDFSAGNAELMKLLPDYSQPVLFLYDNQAVLVEDDKLEIVTSTADRK